MILRPRSHQVGPFTVRRDATREIWRVFDETGQRFSAGDEGQALNWAISNAPPAPAPVYRGVVAAIEPQGSIVLVWVHIDTDEEPEVREVPFDRRMFVHLAQARGDRGILGQQVEVWEIPGEAPSIAFVDEPETDVLQFHPKPGAHDGFPF